jgi:hypothetical protein
MKRPEHDEVDDIPEVRDPLGVAISQVIAAVFEALPTDCAERKAALTVAIECHRRIAALLHRRALIRSDEWHDVGQWHFVTGVI